MKKDTITIGGHTLKVYSFNTIVLGTGAAGFNAADRLYQFGQKDIAIVTEGVNVGTSRNTGSDKQTYYKLTLSGDTDDSVMEMAETLFSGGSMDGDVALCEAALSAQSFLRLAELGVPFPRNRYGEYVGYKTDHDPRTRATSVGPYTSKRMTECLEASVGEKDIAIFDRMQCIKVLSDGHKSYGLLCLNLDASSDEDRFVVFNSKNIIYATGGPAGMYMDSVFPFGHYGSSGIAFEAGVKGQNLTEWQYGLASIKPRWNVSGTYMQVIPKFVSTDLEGNDEREFLFDYFEDKHDLLSKIFMKGYQWPFDVRKIDDGSSIIDILVYIETNFKNRRVFLDFRENPQNQEIDFSKLSEESREYLERADATFGTPYERLYHMNKPAIDFYLDKDVDIKTEMLEIALCAQHNNGGLNIDAWWKTNIEGFYAAGEVSGSHGIYRPGGSALNSGQVGSLRAAQFISENGKGDAIEVEKLLDIFGSQIEDIIELGEKCISEEDNINEFLDNVTRRMSVAGAAIRDKEKIEKAANEVLAEIQNFDKLINIRDRRKFKRLYRLRDILISQYVYLSAMVDYINHGGMSRGSALYTNYEGKKPYDFLPDTFTFTLDDGKNNVYVQEVSLVDDKCEFNWRKVREIPKEDNFFETVWREYRKNKNIF